MASPQDHAARDAARERNRQIVRDQTALLKTLRAEIESAEALRDQGIRSALLLGAPVADLAADAKLKPARIYQIRDNRR